MRWVRARWFGGGMLLGLVAGLLITLGISILAVTSIPSLPQTLSGQPDISMTIMESYLNREAQTKINGSYPTGISSLTLTALTIDIKPDNRMDLLPTFNANVPFVGNLTVNATVNNQLSVQDGKLAIAMVGDPQLGNLNIPLDYLPFDLKGGINNTINNVNNQLLISRINDSLQAGFGGSNFAVEGIATDENGLTIQLKQR